MAITIKSDIKMDIIVAMSELVLVLSATEEVDSVHRGIMHTTDFKEVLPKLFNSLNLTNNIS